MRSDAPLPQFFCSPIYPIAVRPSVRLEYHQPVVNAQAKKTSNLTVVALSLVVIYLRK